ncbi:hypothetical protein [Bradyrhizobium sp. BWA-3-5]|jgi:hypothetical protein|nr:hypothetical protein [Bradyrhizobium sp. BWA-3-5]WOH68802.1 hypothetical protein RX331_14305 [Bradyrhizobium sp. BWA-3-5]
MITLILAQFATTLARFGKEALATWHEAQQLRRQMSGRSEE